MMDPKFGVTAEMMQQPKIDCCKCKRHSHENRTRRCKSFLFRGKAISQWNLFGILPLSHKATHPLLLPFRTSPELLVTSAFLLL